MSTSAFALTFNLNFQLPVVSWWVRPTSQAIKDVTFEDASVNDGLVRTIVGTYGTPPVASAFNTLEEGAVDVTVTNQQLSYSPTPFRIENTTEGITVDITINPSTLQRNVLNSRFTASGTADIDTGTTTIDDVPFVLTGTISTQGSNYVLRGLAHGIRYVSTSPGTFKYAYLKFEIDDTVAIPVAP